MGHSLRQYEIMIAATTVIDEAVWRELWRHINSSWKTPACPRPRQSPVRCGQTNKEMAETYAHVVEKVLKKNGYMVVPAIVPVLLSHLPLKNSGQP